MMQFPEDLKYTTDHEWVKVDGNVAIIGVTDHAQGELGDVVYIDIDDSVEEVAAGESLGTIEAVKTVADLLSPVSGKVVGANEELNDAPEVVNEDPYDKGWMVKIEMSNPSELDALMDVNAYKELIGQ
jgi:glycine cleavage system H protein